MVDYLIFLIFIYLENGVGDIYIIGLKGLIEILYKMFNRVFDIL